MRDWTLGPGDPLALTLTADFRLCAPDYVNDQIWELEPGGGDPPALALRTTYGLRARSMRIFPRFTLAGQTISDPAAFTLPPRLRRFFPNFLSVDFSPFPGIDVVSEYWAPDSHTVAGRITVTNRNGDPVTLLMDLCGQMVPLEGQPFAAIPMQSANVLAGRCADLAPVLFLTGGPQPAAGPYPALTLDLALASGGSRILTWVQASLATREDSFEMARRTAARPWDAERARIELVNTTQTIEVRTGDPDWDAAFALSQKTAFGLFFGAGMQLPAASFVATRQPDQGYSPRGDGSDYSHLWNGQTPLDSYYIANVLPGAPELAEGLIRNFLSTQAADGSVDMRPGLAGQRGRWLAAPLLASLAWKLFQRTHNLDFLHDIQAELTSFGRVWFRPEHDRDSDGFPEWDHPLQSGFEDNPAFNIWHAGGQGASISAAESPALASMLCRDFHAQARIAGVLGQPSVREILELESGRLRMLAEDCWDADAALYHLRDRDSHRTPTGKLLASQRGPGTLTVDQTFRQPVRLLVQVQLKGESTRRPEVTIQGSDGESEHLERLDFQWGAGVATATSRGLFSGVTTVEIAGLEKRDQISISVMDFSGEDVTLFMPLWAEIPNSRRARNLANRTLFAGDRFGYPFGIPACAPNMNKAKSRATDPVTESACHSVHLPWNLLIGEGLLAYDMREEAAQLTVRLMSAIIENLKKQHAFYRAYHAETGTGIGERNPVQGLAPLGLFLETLGVEIHSQWRVMLTGKNPFPWPVTVKYRGLTVTRQSEQTIVAFPDGQSLTLNDPVNGLVTAE